MKLSMLRRKCCRSSLSLKDRRSRSRLVVEFRRRAWIEEIRHAIMARWLADEAPTLGPIRVSMTHVFAGAAVDLDNLAKPVLDALKGLVYQDDGQVTDIAMRKRDMARDLRISMPVAGTARGFQARRGIFAHSRRTGAGSGVARMMQASIVSTTMRRVQQIAQEYKDKGYEVLVEPEGLQLPRSLAGFRPDLVARKGDEVVVVEVKSRASLDDPQLQELAEAVRRQAGWRFELILIRAEPGPPGTKEWNAEDVAHNLRQVETLLRSAHQEAALLLAWSAAEATLRLLAKKERLALEREDAPYLLKLLATRAVVTREQHDLLSEVLELRNAVAHGLKPPELDPARIESLCKTSAGLLGQARRTREGDGALRDHP